MQMTDAEFLHIVNHMKRYFGIELGKKRVLIDGRMSNYLTQHGFETYSDFLKLVDSNPYGLEAQELVNILTTNHTFFLREPVHFEFMKETVLPWIKSAYGRSKDVRIWSAASSSGEEPYTIAMILSDFFSTDVGWNQKLLATDLSTKMLNKALKGVYSEQEISNIPSHWKNEHFRKQSDGNYKISKQLQDMVEFRQFNLMDDIKFKGKFHLVFLRNVMIYFENETKTELINRIYDKIEDGGYLFIGTTESIDKSKTKFSYVQPSVYRKI